MICLDKETVVAYLSGDLNSDRSEHCAAHVAGCTTCRALVEEISGVIDGVRQDLLLVDESVNEVAIPPVESIRSRAAQRGKSHRRWSRLHSPISRQERGSRSEDRARTGARLFLLQPLWVRVASAVVVLAVTVSGLFYLSGRRSVSVVSADELLQRAEQATVNARTLPDRIVHRIWRETVSNGLGPLPDGTYQFEKWWDNVNNRFAYLRFNADGTLVEGNWLLEDGTTYGYWAFGENGPRVTVGPSNQEISQAIELLPETVREKVRAYEEQRRRPFVEVASELLSDMERSISDSMAGRKENASAHAVTRPDGGRAYWAIFHVDVTAPGALVTRWDVSQLILDRTYSVIEDRRIGYRRDGLVYEITRVLLDEQISFPGEADARVFSPGPFPPDADLRRVSAGERVEVLRRAATGAGKSAR
jgi:hypothetical protein